MLKNLYTGIKAKVSVNGVLSEELVNKDGGVDQGGVESPLLFILFFAIIMRIVKKNLGPNIGVTIRVRVNGIYKDIMEITIFEAMFADDVVIMEHCPVKLQIFAHEFERVCNIFGMAISETKSVFMFQQSRNGPIMAETIFTNLEGKEYKNVKEYLYLGFNIQTHKRDDQSREEKENKFKEDMEERKKIKDEKEKNTNLRNKKFNLNNNSLENSLENNQKINEVELKKVSLGNLKSIAKGEGISKLSSYKTSNRSELEDRIIQSQNKIKLVDNPKYKSIKDADNPREKEFSRRMSKAGYNWMKWRFILCNFYTPLDQRMKYFKVCVLTAITSCVGITIINESDVIRLDKFIVDCLRSMIGWKRFDGHSKFHIYMKCGILSTRSLLILARFNWVNYLLKINDGSLAKCMLGNNRCYINNDNSDGKRIGTILWLESYVGCILKDLKSVKLITSQQFDNFKTLNRKENVNLILVDEMFFTLLDKEKYLKNIEEYDNDIHADSVAKSEIKNNLNPDRFVILNKIINSRKENYEKIEDQKIKNKVERKKFTAVARIMRCEEKRKLIEEKRNNSDDEEYQINEVVIKTTIFPKVNQEIKVQVQRIKSQREKKQVIKMDL